MPTCLGLRSGRRRRCCSPPHVNCRLRLGGRCRAKLLAVPIFAGLSLSSGLGWGQDPEDAELDWVGMIEYLCDECKSPISNGEGLLYVPDSSRDRWCIVHDSCDPTPDDHVYEIPVERIREDVEAIDWTYHLLEKNWFASTGWRGVLLTVLGDRVGCA